MGKKKCCHKIEKKGKCCSGCPLSTLDKKKGKKKAKKAKKKNKKNKKKGKKSKK